MSLHADSHELTQQQRKHIIAIGMLGLIALIGLALTPPIPQDPTYHAFLDARELFGLPNFWNVASNLPFLLFGVFGLYALRKPSLPGLIPVLRPAYTIFFIGASLVAFGSGYYHLHPNNHTLLWDRLPMTIAFMAFFSIVIGEHIDLRWALRVLWPLIIIGAASVVYWHITESAGHGDLRPYAVVQFLPVLFIPLLLWLLPSRFNSTKYFWLVIATYVLAKVLEFFDGGTYNLLHVISGHSLKHVAAAVGVYFMVLALRDRRVGSHR